MNKIQPLEWYNERRIVKDLIPYQYNPRRLTEEKKEKLRKSLEKFNLAEVPAINTDNVIIAGHQRIIVLLELGRGNEEIDVRVPSRTLTQDEFKEYNIRSNINVGEWDLDILNEIFADMDLMDFGLDLNDIPLPEDNIPVALLGEQESGFSPELPKEAVTVSGDFYEMRSIDKKITHRVVCGDSRLKEVYELLLEGRLFHLVVTDPPYNVNYEGATSDKLKIENDNMTDNDFQTFLYEFYKQTYDHCAAGACVYVFHADTEGINFRGQLKAAGFKLSQILIWLKNHFALGRQDYHWKHEPILYGWKEGSGHSWYSDRSQCTVLEFDKPLRNEEHPTMKPIDLISYLIKNSSKQLGVVGDPFLGSGSTLIACEQTWRQCCGVELDPRYVDVIVRRWIRYIRENHLTYELSRNGKLLCSEEIALYFK